MEPWPPGDRLGFRRKVLSEKEEKEKKKDKHRRKGKGKVELDRENERDTDRLEKSNESWGGGGLRGDVYY